MTRTKIVCTIGPSSESPDVIRGLIRAGMDVARINFSHGDFETHARSIAAVRSVAAEEGALVSIMADLPGPKLRVGDLPAEGIDCRSGDEIILVHTDDYDKTDTKQIPVPHANLLHYLEPKQVILFDDGMISAEVIRGDGKRAVCRVINGGRLLPHKGINLPGGALHFSALTPKDREVIVFSLEHQIDLFALSFVRHPADVKDLRSFLDSRCSGVPIIAKIEKPEALAVFDDILASSDGIMVARGDLGVETPAEEVPFHQKRIIQACNRVGKPVITATQMLQSMIENPSPTRAEASDVANAVLDGTDAVMLSGETAVGAYPIHSVQTMDTICTNAEAHLPLRCEHTPFLMGQSSGSITEAISNAAVDIASEVGARAIVTATMSGLTAQMIACRRPRVPVLAVTPSQKTLYRLALVWGVQPVLTREFDTTDEMVQLMTKAAVDEGVVKSGECLVLTAGIPFGKVGETNMLKVQVVP